MLKNAAVLTLAIFLSVLMTVVAGAAPPAQGEGQEYTVQAGDWLSKIAEKYYGDPLAYSAIVEATNAKAATDNSFVAISDPNAVEVGQKLWIPDAAEGTEAPAASGDAATLPTDPASLQQAYLNAVKDAEVAEPGEISKNLMAIVESNDGLVWQGEAGHQQVLLLTWTSYDGYDQQVGQTLTTSRQTWVTAVPELKTFCATSPTVDNNPALRLEQLLGLPPNNGKTRFVEIWASPADLFRPAPDPEISDTEAELTFPTSKYASISPDYMTWFNDLNGQSYGEQGYPWTRLGYTYDWGNPNSEVGLSEFVIDQGATVSIKAVTLTDDYCQTGQ